MDTSTQPLRAGVYGRQSRGKEKSITDQIDECSEDAERQGWHIVERYQDGSSASRFARKGRDDWARVLADIDAYRLDVLVIWEPSRGDRTLATWAALLDLCRERDVQIRVTEHRRTYDMTNDRDWRSMAEDGIDSAHESNKISGRVRRGQASAARAGRPSQGRTPYGYRRAYDPNTGTLVGQEPDPVTAPVVREIFERAAGSEPISRIVDDLNARNVPTLGAVRWYRVRVRDIAINPAYAGLRQFNGQTYAGTWPALVDEATFYTVQRVLSEPSRTTTRPGRVRHLLSYLGTCGPCGAPLTSVRGRYRCFDNGCVTMVQGDVDEFVTEVILTRMAKPNAYAKLRKVGDDADQEIMTARAEAAQLRARLDEFRVSAARGRTSPESLAIVEAELTADIRKAESRAQRASVPPALRDLLTPGKDVRGRWEVMPLAARREAIRALVTVAIRPASAPGSRTAEYERIDIEWLDLAGSR